MLKRLKLAGGLATGAAAGLALALGIHTYSGDASVAAQIAPMDTTPVTRVAPNSASQMSLSFAPVVKATAPAVVNIYTAKVDRSRASLMDEFIRRSFGGAPPQPRV